MDETPEELAQIRVDAEKIDVYRYRKRFRIMKAAGLGALMAGLCWLVLVMLDSRRNPCERVRDHFCNQDAKGMQCKMYTGIMEESLEDDSEAMRANIKSQCQSKIERMKEEDSVTVK